MSAMEVLNQMMMLKRQEEERNRALIEKMVMAGYNAPQAPQRPRGLPGLLQGIIGPERQLDASQFTPDPERHHEMAATRRQQKTQEFQRAERLGGQEFQTSERVAGEKQSSKEKQLDRRSTEEMFYSEKEQKDRIEDAKLALEEKKLALQYLEYLGQKAATGGQLKPGEQGQILDTIKKLEERKQKMIDDTWSNTRLFFNKQERDEFARLETMIEDAKRWLKGDIRGATDADPYGMGTMSTETEDYKAAQGVVKSPDALDQQVQGAVRELKPVSRPESLPAMGVGAGPGFPFSSPGLAEDIMAPFRRLRYGSGWQPSLPDTTGR